MTKWDPDFVQGNGTTPSYTAKEFRFGARAEDWDQGVRTRRSLKVSQRGAGANMTVDVAAGDAIVAGTKQAFQGNYAIRSDAVESVAGFTAPSAGLQRYDLVVVKVNDPDATEAAGDNITFERVAGTASGSPAVPTFPTTALVLAIVGPLTNTTTSITNSMIHDAHTGTGPAGAELVRLISGHRDNPGVSKETYQTVAPSGWLMQDGSAVSRTTYADLFAEIGVAHGAGNGTTTFNLPDSRGRVAVARDNMGVADAGRISSANTVGATGGAETVALSSSEMPVHNHTLAINNHSHGDVIMPGTLGGTSQRLAGDYASGVTLGSTGRPVLEPNILGSISNAAYTQSVALAGSIGNAGNGAAHNNMQPFITLNRMIRT